jgi:tetratricopeptide (TPR) repeat protein
MTKFSSSDKSISRIITLFSQGKYDKVIKKTNSVIKQKNPNPDRLHYRGRALVKKRLFTKGISCYQKALIEEPNEINILHSLATAYFYQHEYNSAIRTLEILIKSEISQELINEYHNLLKRVRYHISNTEGIVQNRKQKQVQNRILKEQEDKKKQNLNKKVENPVKSKYHKINRLSKVAREYGIGMHLIVEFLQRNGFKIENNPNSKIPSGIMDLIHNEFNNREWSGMRHEELLKGFHKVQLRL